MFFYKNKRIFLIPIFDNFPNRVANAILSIEDCYHDDGHHHHEIQGGRKIRSLKNIRKIRSHGNYGHSWSRNLIEKINGYGCWCYFNGDINSGKGPVVLDNATGHRNAVDQYCKILQNGYQCMLIDDASCDPTSVSFTSATGLALQPAFSLNDDKSHNSTKASTIWSACQAVNENECQAQACAVEGYFILNLFDLFLSGQQLDNTLSHQFGYFQPSQECLLNSNNFGESTGDAVCCGTYPERAKHQIRQGFSNRECCGRHYIDTSKRTCCDKNSGKTTFSAGTC